MEPLQQSDHLVDLVTELVYLTRRQQLTQVERLLIERVLNGTGQYRELAEQSGYSERYLKNNVGFNLWQLLTEVFDLGIKVTKNNFPHILVTHQARLQERVIQLRQFSSLKRISHTSSQIYGQLPRLNQFYGREAELATLGKQLSEFNCINIYGQPGIGKSALVTRYLMQPCEFEYVIYHSLYDAPPLIQLIQYLQKLLPLNRNGFDPPAEEDSIDSSIQHLVQTLKLHRCLLIFDDADQVLLRSGSSLDPYPPGYQDYGKLIRQVVHSLHSSCLLLLSRIGFKDLEWMKSHNLPCALLPLKGLEIEAARQILARQKIGMPSEQEQLATLYYGNPLLLQLVAEHITEQFNKDAAEYLQLETTLAPDRFAYPIQQQLTHTTDLERKILLLLALSPTLTLNALLEKLEAESSPISKSEVLEALKSLYQQALIERQVQPDSKVNFLLQPVMRKCVLKQFAPPVSLAR